MIKLKPCIRSAGKLSAMNMGDGSLVDFTVTRDGFSSEIDSNKYIVFVPSNMPTLVWKTDVEEDSEHYKFTPFVPVLQTQLSATNKLLYPYSFVNSYWTKSGVSVDNNNGNGYPSPFKDASGVKLLASKLVESDAAGTTHRILNGYSSTISDTWSFTTILKSNGRNARMSLVFDDDNNKYDQVNFDLKNGTYSGIGHGGVANIEPLADGWFKCNFTLTGSNVQGVTYYVYTLDGTNTVYQGDGTSGIYIAYAQLEEGNPTSPITHWTEEGSGITRNADNIYITTPSGVTKITETFVDDTENVITTIPTTYQLTEGKYYKQVVME